MREKIVFVNQLNAIELLRTATLKRGPASFVYRFYNEDDLLDFVKLKRGLFMKGQFIKGEDIVGTILLAFSSQHLEYEDGQNLKAAFEQYAQCELFEMVASMRKVLSDDFKQKKDILITAYERYQEYKKAHQLYDKFDLMRSLLALDWQQKLEGVVVFSQFSLTKTQQLFLKTVFKEIKVESLKDYVHNCENVVKEVIKSYGAVNEIAAVINKIASENLNLGQCQIVLIKPDYLYHLINKVDYLSLVNEKKVAITYRQGFPLSLTTPGQMLLAIKNLAAKLYGIDEYDYFFESAFFNKKLINPTMNDRWWAAFKKYVGWLRLSFEDANEVTAIYEENGMFEALQIFNADLKKGIPFFIKKYCLITEETRDQAALSVIESSFTSLQKYGLNQAKIINILLRKNVNQTLSAPNALHVTTLDYAFESNRPYTFIVGLSGDYPGQPTENCLIFDDEFLKIDDSGHFTSTQIIKRKDQLLVDFIQGSGQTYLTYPYYRFVDQKDVNPTSYITNYKGLVTEFTFKDDYLSRLHNLISDYQNNCLIENILPLVKRPNYDFKRLLDKKYSPSRLATYFFGHKLVFVFNELFGLNLGDENDPFEVIPANEKGVLIHAALEGYQEGDDQKEVRSKALSLFRNFIKQKPSDLKSSVADIEADFMLGVDCLLELPLGKDAECEKYYEGTINGLRFGGVVDRIARVGQKNVLIDYKTGRRSYHDINNPQTFIQGLIYAELISTQSSKWRNIDEIWFVYPYEATSKRIMKITFDKKAKEVLYSAIEQIKELFVSGEFESVKSTREDNEAQYTEQYAFLFSLYEQLIKKGGQRDGT